LITKTIPLTIRRSSALSVRPRLGLGSLGSVASIAVKASDVMEIVTVLSNNVAVFKPRTGIRQYLGNTRAKPQLRWLAAKPLQACNS
jgi:hypothetical protein